MTRSEVLKFSAGGFRDFTRIAASDPTMWRDVFLANKDAVLEMLGRFNEDLSTLTRAIRHGDGDTLFNLFTRTRAIRRASSRSDRTPPRPTSAGHTPQRSTLSRGLTRPRINKSSGIYRLALAASASPTASLISAIENGLVMTSWIRASSP